MDRILIVGLGLIGGSVAKSLPAEKTCALDRDERQLKAAAGYTGAVYSRLEDIKEEPDTVLICVPVSSACSMAGALAKRFPNAVFIDCCSTKRSVQRAYENAGVMYAGMHPMAGSEGSGFANARAGLFHGAIMCITGSGRAREEARKLALLLGGCPMEISAQEHDAATAAVSHLPHIAAAALVRAARLRSQEVPALFDLAAGGFSDLTRIADSDPIMWGSVFADNSDEILQSLDAFEGEIKKWRQLLLRKNEAELAQYFADCKRDKALFRRGDRGIYPKDGVRGFFACRPEEQAEKAKTAFENGAYAITAEENGINVVCRQRDEFERAAAALTAEEK